MLQDIKNFVKDRVLRSRTKVKKRAEPSSPTDIKIFCWVKIHQEDIILVIGAVLISLLSFAMGYITAKQKEKEPLQIGKIYEENSRHWSWNIRTLSGLEIS